MPITVHSEADANAVASAAARFLAEAIGSRIAAAGICTIALAGGASPLPLYHRLRGEEHGIDWGRVRIVQTDDVLTKDIEARSTSRIAAALNLAELYGEALADHWYPIPHDVIDPATSYQDTLARLTATGGPDIAVLGLGIDGHTAGVFAHHLTDPPTSTVALTSYHGQARITLTATYLRSAPVRMLLALGVSKNDALRALLQPDPATPIPATVVLGADGHVFADSAALEKGF
ncbi:6-phosphogluconolactonase [Nocardia sp. NPDC050435]|uniref:6-phosphogluconolactonase n=1 Tax=Nocardia sp. NPDC050435 TaxID=3155040 RepID=UPI0033CC8F1A